MSKLSELQRKAAEEDSWKLYRALRDDAQLRCAQEAVRARMRVLVEQRLHVRMNEGLLPLNCPGLLNEYMEAMYEECEDLTIVRRFGHQHYGESKYTNPKVHIRCEQAKEW